MECFVCWVTSLLVWRPTDSIDNNKNIFKIDFSIDSLHMNCCTGLVLSAIRCLAQQLTKWETTALNGNQTEEQVHHSSAHQTSSPLWQWGKREAYSTATISVPNAYALPMHCLFSPDCLHTNFMLTMLSHRTQFDNK